MESLQFECIWGNESSPEIGIVQELWRKHGVLIHEDLIEKRSGEIVYVVKNGFGEVGGVSTARPVQVAFLNNHFFYEFRSFIIPGFRAPALDSMLALKTKQFLETLPGSVTTFKGMIIMVENEELKRQRTKAVWPATGMVFAGYNSKGHHIRVGYFKGARI